jgi:hypothetical protein
VRYRFLDHRASSSPAIVSIVSAEPARRSVSVRALP